MVDCNITEDSPGVLCPVALTTAWHSQMDGQTERVNQELDQFLRLFVNERQND